MIEVILKEPVDNLGHRGDVVRVADGYARNYLLPRNLALAVTAGNKRQIDAEKKRASAKEAEERTVADALASRLSQAEVVVARRVGEKDIAVRLGHVRATSPTRSAARASRSTSASCSSPIRSRRWANTPCRSACTAKSPRR